MNFLVFLLLIGNTINPQFNLGLFNLGYIDFVVFVMLFITLANYRRLQNFPQISSFVKIYKVLFIYFVFLIIYSFTKGVTYNDIFGKFRNLFIYPLMFFVGLLAYSNKFNYEKFIRTLRLYLFFAVLIGVAKTIYPLEIFRYRGMNDINGGMYFVLVHFGTALLSFILFYYDLINSKQITFLKKYFYLAVDIIAILFAFNRLVVISFVLTLLVFYLKYNKKFFSKTNLSKILTTLMVFFFISVSLRFSGFLDTGLYKNRIEVRMNKIEGDATRTDYIVYGTSISTRIARVWAGVTIWRKSPIIGNGWGGLGYVDFVDPILHRFVYTLDNPTVMSYYVSLLVKTGIIGFVIIMAFWGKVYKNLKPSLIACVENNNKLTFYLFLLGYLIYSISSYNLIGDAPFIATGYFIFGFGVMYSIRTKEENNTGYIVKFKNYTSNI